MSTSNLPAEDRAVLAERPWLEPFIEPQDTNIDVAISRYADAMSACLAELRAAGRTVYKRMLTADGCETTALATHPKDSR